MIKFYVSDDEYSDMIYGSAFPTLLTNSDLKWLAREWEMSYSDIRAQVHEATLNELINYNVTI